jgi:hypothetical protein
MRADLSSSEQADHALAGCLEVIDPDRRVNQNQPEASGRRRGGA